MRSQGRWCSCGRGLKASRPRTGACAVDPLRSFRHAVEAHQRAAKQALRSTILRTGLDRAHEESAGEIVLTSREDYEPHLPQRGRILRIESERRVELCARAWQIAF